MREKIGVCQHQLVKIPFVITFKAVYNTWIKCTLF